MERGRGCGVHLFDHDTENRVGGAGIAHWQCVGLAALLELSQGFDAPLGRIFLVEEIFPLS